MHWFCCKYGDRLQENNAKLGYLWDTTQKVKRSTLPQNAAARCAHCEAPTPHRSREKCKKQIQKNWQRQPSHFFISSYFIQLGDRYPKVLLQNNETPWSYKHIFFPGLREICEGYQQRIIIMYATDTCIIVRETPHQTEKRFIVSIQFTECERLIDFSTELPREDQSPRLTSEVKLKRAMSFVIIIIIISSSPTIIWPQLSTRSWRGEKTWQYKEQSRDSTDIFKRFKSFWLTNKQKKAVCVKIGCLTLRLLLFLWGLDLCKPFQWSFILPPQSIAQME